MAGVGCYDAMTFENEISTICKEMNKFLSFIEMWTKCLRSLRHVSKRTDFLFYFIKHGDDGKLNCGFVSCHRMFFVHVK